MAERRMFAKTIIDSDAFLDMPLSSQALYFHLSMRADDEGFINNPKKIVRMIGASEDELKLLIAKHFVIPFDSGVCVIKHWRIHNYIQKDRFKETVYQEERAMLTIKENNAYTLDTGCIHDGYTSETQVRIGKDSIVKDRLTTTRAYTREEAVPYDLQECMDLWNGLSKYGIKQVIDIAGMRYMQLKDILQKHGMDAYKKAIENISSSVFLQGNNKKGWVIPFDWFLTHFTQVLEGQYEDKKGKTEMADGTDDEWSAALRTLGRRE